MRTTVEASQQQPETIPHVNGLASARPPEDPPISADLKIEVGDWPEDVLDRVVTFCAMFKRADFLMLKLSRNLGRGLCWLRSNWDESCRERYGTFSNFITTEVVGRMRICRSTAYNSMTLYAKFTGLSVDDWEAAGTSNLLLLSTFTSEDEPSFPRLLEQAKNSTRSDLLKFAHENGHIDRSDVLRTVLVINCSQNTAQHWRELCSDPRVQSKAGGTSEDRILEAMMQIATPDLLAEEG